MWPFNEKPINLKHYISDWQYSYSCSYCGWMKSTPTSLCPKCGSENTFIKQIGRGEWDIDLNDSRKSPWINKVWVEKKDHDHTENKN